MLQEAIISVIESYKSYMSLSKKYEEDKNKLKGKPRFQRYKKEKASQEIVFTKYAIRVEEIVKENYNKKRRVSRGIFITNGGKKINADINGSLNILRKYIKKSKPNQEIAMDNGREQRPLKKRVA